MKILNVLLKEKIREDEEFNTIYVNNENNIVVNFIDESNVTYTSVIIDGSEYPMIDTYNPVQMLQFMCDLRDYLDEMDDTRIFGTEDTFIRIMDDVDSNIKFIKDDCLGEDSDQSSENDEDEPKLRIMNSMNMVAGIPVSSVNWDTNAENLETIEETMDLCHEKIAAMMSGEIDFTEVLDTAESILDTVGMPTNYEFPNTTNVSNREVAILKMFDAFALYAKLFAYTGVYRTRKEITMNYEKLIEQLVSDGVDEDVSDVYEASEAINNEGS